MIDEALALRAKAALAGLSRGRWENVHTEIQDDFTFLLLSADAPSMSGTELTATQRAEIATAMNELVPAHPSHGLGSWMVVFKRMGEVFASVYPGPGGL